MKLLVLRPAAGAEATAKRAHTHGYDTVIAPLFTYRALSWTQPERAAVDAVLLTSAAAVRLGGEGLTGYRDVPVRAVGSATAAAAAAAGFTDVTASETDAQAAIAALAASGHRTILHPAGLDHIAIADPRVSVLRCHVYTADASDILPTEAERALDTGAVALLHSPRAAEVFRGLLHRSGRRSANIRIGCFSPAVAARAGTGWAGVGIAERPTDDALFAAVAMLCDQDRGKPREGQ